MGSLLGKIFNKAPVPYVGARTGGLLGSGYSEHSSAAYLKSMAISPTLYGIVSRTSSAVSLVEWHLYRHADGRGRIAGDEDRVEVTKHPALALWNRPNPFHTRQRLVESTQQHVDLTGEGWWVVYKNFNMPVEVWHMRPDRMRVVPSKDEVVAGYVYCGPDGDEIPLGRDEVIQIMAPDPESHYRGLSPIRSLQTDIESARYASEYNRNFFTNGAEPGGLIKFDRKMSDDEFKEWQERWRETHRGASAAHRVGVIEEGAEWIPNTQSMKDMDFKELRDFERDVQREAYGIPKAILGLVDDVNRANAEAGAVVFAQHCTVPRLERFKAALNYNFLPMFGGIGTGVEFDYENPVPEDVEKINSERNSRVEAATKLITVGFDPEKTLEALGLPDIPFVGKPESVDPIPGNNDSQSITNGSTDGEQLEPQNRTNGHKVRVS